MAGVRRRIRAAARVQELWCREAARPFDFDSYEDRLLGHLAELRRCRKRHREASRRGWLLTAGAAQEEFRWEADSFGRYLHDVLEGLRSPRAGPGLRHWLAELDELDSEFGGWELDRYGELSVTTESICLQDEELGRFRLALKPEAVWRNPCSECFAVTALDPNPAPGDATVTHPHVRQEGLCAGDAHDAIGQALTHGRLADAFVLVRSVLRTYNPSSPFVPLEQWAGPTCDDCGDTFPEDEAGYCDACGVTLCDSCQSYCAQCDRSRCGTCLESCAVCGDRFCTRCLSASALSERDCCPDCRRRCAGCGRVVAEDELDEDLARCNECTPTTAASPDAQDEETTDETRQPPAPAPAGV